MEEELGIYVKLANYLNVVSDLIYDYGKDITLNELSEYLYEKKDKFKNIIIETNKLKNDDKRYI